MESALIVRPPWAKMIVTGEKIWEMRSSPTHIRGLVGIIEQGTGLIIGECHIKHSPRTKLTNKQLIENERYHRVSDHSLLEKWRFAWIISHAKIYEKPIQYNHPRGAVTWVKI